MSFDDRLRKVERSVEDYSEDKYADEFWECGDLVKNSITRFEFEEGKCREIKMKQVY